jgi:hypothetical protein
VNKQEINLKTATAQTTALATAPQTRYATEHKIKPKTETVLKTAQLKRLAREQETKLKTEHAHKKVHAHKTVLAAILIARH